MFIKLLGWIFISLIGHEAYHWFFSSPTKVCYVSGKGFAVYGTGTDEIWSYVIMILIFIFGTVYEFNHRRSGDNRKRVC